LAGLLEDIRHVVRDRFDAYVASKAAVHVVQRERAQLERIDAKLERFAARIEAALAATDARVEGLRGLEGELRATLEELRRRGDDLRITGMEELLVLIDSLRNVGSAPPQTSDAAVSAAIKRLAGQPERPHPPGPSEQRSLHSVRVGQTAPERPASHAPASTFADVEGWRPDEDMRLMEVDVDRDAT